MAISAVDMNQARVDILGTTVDNPGATWTTAPPGAANRLTTAERIITRAINQLNTNAAGILDTVSGFGDRFTAVVGEEAAGAADEAAFNSIGMNLIQAVAALVAGGGISPEVSFAFAFPNPVQTNDFVDVPVTQDCTIPLDLAGSEYHGTTQTDDMHFELTEQPSGTILGQIAVNAGNLITLSGTGGTLTTGVTLRMTANNIVAGSAVADTVIRVVAARKLAPPVTGGRYQHQQTTDAATWTVNHDLDARYVAVQVVDDSGNQVIGDVDFQTDDRCVLHFSKAISGTVVIRR